MKAEKRDYAADFEMMQNDFDPQDEIEPLHVVDDEGLGSYLDEAFKRGRLHYFTRQNVPQGCEIASHFWRGYHFEKSLHADKPQTPSIA